MMSIAKLFGVCRKSAISQAQAAISAVYGSRPATRMSHRSLAMAHLDLEPFSSEPLATFMNIATHAAFDTDDGRISTERLVDAIRTRDIVLSNTDTLERIGIAGRAWARLLPARCDPMCSELVLPFFTIVPRRARFARLSEGLRWMRPRSTGGCASSARRSRNGLSSTDHGEV